MYFCPLCNKNFKETDNLKKVFCVNCKDKNRNFNYLCPSCKFPIFKNKK